MTRVIHYICNIKIKDFLLCQYVIYGPSSSVNIILTGPYITYWPRKKSIIDKYYMVRAQEDPHQYIVGIIVCHWVTYSWYVMDVVYNFQKHLFLEYLKIQM